MVRSVTRLPRHDDRRTATRHPQGVNGARLRCWLPTLLLGSLMTGCPASGPPTGVPQGGEFQHDASCTLEGALSIEIGDGTDGFASLGAGEGPVQHFGPQGGTHSFAGLRIGGLALDRYDVVLVQMTMFEAAACPQLGSACTGSPMNASQTWVLGDVAPLEIVGDDVIEQDQLVVPVGSGNVVLQALAEDPCGRVGLGQISFLRSDL